LPGHIFQFHLIHPFYHCILQPRLNARHVNCLDIPLLLDLPP
jgi:hypothetical protein